MKLSIISKFKFHIHKRINRDILFNLYIKFFKPQIDSEAEMVSKIRLNLLKNNRKLPGRKPRIFIAVKNVNWEKAGLVDSWRKIADVTHYDWNDEFDQNSPDWEQRNRRKFNDKLLDAVLSTYNKKPFDIFFSYLSGNWVYRDTIEEISKLGVITVNFSFDDFHSFWGRKIKSGWTGNAGIADAFDICITTQNRKDLLKYDKVGARALYMPPAGNQDVFGLSKPLKKRKISVSFIGQKYGLREEYINFLIRNGIQVYTAGIGWESGAVSQKEMLDMYSNSLLTIGFGFIGNTTRVGLKGRDFEVPMTGAAYITTYNELLSEYFTEDKEIIFYRDKNELLTKIRYYIENPESAIQIGMNARKRSLAEHTWEKRWKKLLDVIGN